MMSTLDVITSFSYLSIRMAPNLGLTISLLSMLAAIFVLLNRLVFGFGELGWGWPSLIITMLFLGGIQLVMLGIIGEYLWRIGSQVRGHPQYIVMRQVGFEDHRRSRSPLSRPFALEENKCRPRSRGEDAGPHGGRWCVSPAGHSRWLKVCPVRSPPS